MSAGEKKIVPEGEVEIVLFEKKGCHLCEEVESEIRSMKLNLTLVDIDGDESLHNQYWMRIPVVVIGGKVVFEAKEMDRQGGWKNALRAFRPAH